MATSLSRGECLQAIREAVLYGIVDLGYVSEADIETTARELITGGAGVIQLRAKGCEKVKVAEMADRLAPICHEAKVPFIVNDYADIAVQSGADGVHIGQDDGSLAAAREVVGPDMIVGRSTHSVEQALAARDEGFDYGGFGPLFPTPTKKGRLGIGLENIPQVEAEVSPQMPLFYIGGIKPENLSEVMAAGAKRVVIVSALLLAEDRIAATRSVVRCL